MLAEELTYGPELPGKRSEYPETPEWEEAQTTWRGSTYRWSNSPAQPRSLTASTTTHGMREFLESASSIPSPELRTCWLRLLTPWDRDKLPLPDSCPENTGAQ